MIKTNELSLNHLTESLVSYGIISKRDRDEITDRRTNQTEDERMSHLLGIVIATIKGDGTVFGQLLEIFEKEYAQRGKTLANTLRSKYNEGEIYKKLYITLIYLFFQNVRKNTK